MRAKFCTLWYTGSGGGDGAEDKLPYKGTLVMFYTLTRHFLSLYPSNAIQLCVPLLVQ